MPYRVVAVTLILLLSIVLIPNCSSKQDKQQDHVVIGDKSPYYQYLPDCSKEGNHLTKKTTGKGIICPMIRDEEGFLSEWVAYYQIHGFDHIMFFDDGTIDDSLVELKPWIDSGFVSIRSNFTVDTHNVSWAHRKNSFKSAMALKALLERECKLKAIEWGYDIFISLDIDEYFVPYNYETAMDALMSFIEGTGRSQYCIEKMNFPSTPHLLEPVNLLTIEAYQSRMQHPAKMNYYTSVSPKCSYALKGSSFGNTTAEFIATCCHFHGCQGHDFIEQSMFCNQHYKDEAWKISGKGKPWHAKGVIFHYSRSLEKFTLKAKTWRTATGEVQINQTSAEAATGYDITKFFARSIGWFHDDSALRFSCQVRAHLAAVTGKSPYLRPGTKWYRNPEFGVEVTDPDKRGRYGRPNADGFKYSELNPYHYHGNGQKVAAPL